MAKSLIAFKAPLAKPTAPVANPVRGRLPSVHTAWVEFTSQELNLLAKHLDATAIDELAEL